ncbi:hypothetical protein Vretimale_19257, partial [Volvox reticuliferus]
LPPHTNVAVGKTAYASSVFGTSYGPENAIDGTIPSLGSNSSTFISGNSSEHWLSIDFGEQMTVSQVTLYNRMDCCGEQLYNAEFRLGGAAVFTNNSDQLPYNDLIHTMTGASIGGTTGGTVTFSLNPPSTGRFLTVKNGAGSGELPFLPVAELQVSGVSAVCIDQMVYGGLHGTGLSSLINLTLSDEAACCQACNANNACFYWDFDRVNGRCRLLRWAYGSFLGVTLLPYVTRVAGAKR